MLQNDAWHLAAGIPLLLAGIAVFVGGAILLFRITSIEVPGRLHDDANARTSEYYGYTDPGSQTYGSYWDHHGGGHDGGAGGGN